MAPVDTIEYGELVRQAGLSGDIREMSREALLKLREFEGRIWRTEVEVRDIIPELETVVVASRDHSIEMRLTDKVKGLQWRQLSVGQHLFLTVRGALAPQAMSAEIA
jgi:hypothetical protein